MENQENDEQLPQRCRGITASGDTCKRAPSRTNAHGYCYQHAYQYQPPNNNNNDNNAEAEESSSTGDDENNIGNNNNDNDVVAVMARCEAVATTTKLRCKKVVSFAGEHFCPLHGGRQHKPKAVLPQCQSITKTTRQQCKRRVNFEGESCCSHHGGRKVSQGPKIKQQQQDPVTVARFVQNERAPTLLLPPLYDVLGLAQACMHFMCDTHPRMMGKCGCDTLNATPGGRICRSMAIVRWVQTLLKLMQQTGGNLADADPQTVLMPLLEHLNMQTIAPLFADLRTAVAIFESSNSSSSSLLDFLPALFTRMRHLNVAKRNHPSPSSPATIAAEDTNEEPISSIRRSPSMSNLAAWSDIAPMFDDDNNADDAAEEEGEEIF